VLERQQKADAAGAGSRYSEVMRVKVLYFGLLRDVFGAAGEEVELADGAAVRDLLGLLRARTSKDAMENKTESDADERLWRSLAVAVNCEYGSASIELREGDEVALLPPVSGGLLRGGRVLRARRKARFARGGCGGAEGCGARFAREGMPLKGERDAD
jgi:MoaD family protein